MDAGQRLMNVGLNTAAGATLLGAAGAGVPQIFNENPDKIYKAQEIYDATGVNVAPPGKVPVNRAARIRAERAKAVREGRTFPQRLKRAVDPITSTLEIGAEDVNNYVVNPVKAVGNAVKNAGEAAIDAGKRTRDALLSPDELAIREQKRLIEETNKRATAQEIARLQEEATRQIVTSPENIAKNKQAAEKVVGETTEALLENPRQRLANKAKRAVASIGDAAQTVGEVGKNVSLEAKIRGQEALIDAKNAARSLGNKTKSGITALRTSLGFSYMGDTANFVSTEELAQEDTPSIMNRLNSAKNSFQESTNKLMKTPYKTGLVGGALLGTGIGGGIAIGNSLNQADKEEDAQLANIQAIADPYARKKEWDVYNDGLSRTGRNIGYTTQGLGNTLLGAGAGAAAGGLLGGALLTGAKNVKNNTHNLIGAPLPPPNNKERLKGAVIGGIGAAGVLEGSHLIKNMLDGN